MGKPGAQLMALGVALGITVFGAGESRACFNAYHARRIVLGTSGAAVVVLELDWRRLEGRGTTLRWKGPVRVGLLDAPGAKLRDVRDLPAADVKLDRRVDFDVTSAIKRQIRSALAIARSYPGFRAVNVLPEHRSCDFEPACEDVRIAVDSNGIFLSVTRQGTAVKVPVTVPREVVFDDGDDSPPTMEELASSLKLVSLLRYDVGGREVLVVDLGGGDDERGESEDGLWPPCGCDNVSRCPPVAATMHHGSQFEVVVPLGPPAGAPAAMPPPTPTANPLASGELSQAEAQPKAALRTDGIYSAEPICAARSGWTRRFLRFFADGTVRQVDGNLSPKQAFRLAAKDAVWVYPEGTYKVVGRRVSGTILEDEHYLPRRKWAFDGILDGANLRAMSASAATRTTPAVFRFIPFNSSPH